MLKSSKTCRMTTFSTSSDRLHIDIETYSSQPLAKTGVYKYSESEDFEVLLFAFSFNDEPVEVIDLAHGQQIPERAMKALTDPNVIKVAYNAAFERVCLSRYLNVSFLDPSQWECVMVRALSLGLPASLKDAGAALGLSEEKAKLDEGKKLVRYFCTSTKGIRHFPDDDPERWERFVEYNRQDVVAEMEIDRLLSSWPLSAFERRCYAMDQHINDFGIYVDQDLMNRALECNGRLQEQLKAECLELCGCTPKQVAGLKAWLASNGIEVQTLDKSSVSSLLDRKDLPLKVRRVLEIRQEAGRSSVSKYEAFSRCLCKDGRVHGAFQFDGAGRTGRWAGRLIQPQNFPRPDFDDVGPALDLVHCGLIEEAGMIYGSLTSVMGTLVRSLVCAPEGKMLCVADYSAIEARVIAWIAGEKWRSDAFARGEDIYCASASKMFGVPVKKHGQNGHLRSKGKIAELALGYGGSIGALKAFKADQMGLSEDDMRDIVRKWRAASPKIVRLWRAMGDAAAECILEDHSVTLDQKGIRFRREGRFLFMRIPSGRELAYFDPEIQDGQLTYMGQNQKTGKWERLRTFGGKLTENCVQATARDCLAAALLRVTRRWPVIMHVHDEIIAECPDAGCLADLEDIMARKLPWCPDLLLTADGFAGTYYRKD